MKRPLMLSALILSSIASAATLTYLGPKGTYSDEAARLAAAPQQWTTTTATSITEVAAAVTSGKSDYGLLPVENSTGGWVVETMNQFKGAVPTWRVVGEIDLPINNVLMAKPGTKISDVGAIVSHPQPFLQSADYLKATFPGASRSEAKSTAAAAEAVSKDPSMNVAAIAAPAAAEVYGLNVLANAIQDDKRNTTRFWVVTAAELPKAGPVSRAVVVHDMSKGVATLSLLISRMAGAGMQLASLTQSPSGQLDGARYVAEFSAIRITDIQTVLAALTPGSTLLGAFNQ